MSSILICDMEIPKRCYECRVWSMCFEEKPPYNMIKSVCPLTKIPQHGRLIDADAFEQEMKNGLLPLLTEKYGEEEAQRGLHFSFLDCISNIQCQDTVIERSE